MQHIYHRRRRCSERRRLPGTFFIYIFVSIQATFTLDSSSTPLQSPTSGSHGQGDGRAGPRQVRDGVPTTPKQSLERLQTAMCGLTDLRPLPTPKSRRTTVPTSSAASRGRARRAASFRPPWTAGWPGRGAMAGSAAGAWPSGRRCWAPTSSSCTCTTCAAGPRYRGSDRASAVHHLDLAPHSPTSTQPNPTPNKHRTARWSSASRWRAPRPSGRRWPACSSTGSRRPCSSPPPRSPRRSTPRARTAGWWSTSGTGRATCWRWRTATRSCTPTRVRGTKPRRLSLPLPCLPPHSERNETLD